MFLTETKKAIGVATVVDKFMQKKLIQKESICIKRLTCLKSYVHKYHLHVFKNLLINSF